MRLRTVFCALISSLLLVACGPAKSVSYSHRVLLPEGCTVSYSVVQQNEQLQIAVTVKSDRLVFGTEPTMMLKNYKGNVLKLSGINLQSRSESAGVLVNNVVIPVTELSALAMFPVAESDIEFFKSGISKVRLSTVPIAHEKSFTEDCIGSYLYDALMRAKQSRDDF